MPSLMTADELMSRHRETLGKAVDAMRSRAYFSAFPESPSPRVYGETAGPEGQRAYEAWLGSDFPVVTPGADGRVATERSPFGPELGVTYPHVGTTDEAIDELLAAAHAAMKPWRDVGVEGRTGVCLEIISRLHARVFELAHSVMHTSGQAFVMAFQAGGAHALDRALEAVARGYDEQTRIPGSAVWEKPAKGDPLRLANTFHVVPRGVALVVGCNTFPTWNSWPGLFASLVTGNPVVVKPHPNAALPLAITVQAAREVLKDCGLDQNLVTLAAEHPDGRIAAKLAVRPEVKIVDFTGSSAFGTWLEDNARQAVVFAEKSGVNTVILDSTDDLQQLTANLAFSLSLYTGQMCTAPQNVYVPRGGIATPDGQASFDEVGMALAEAVSGLLGDEKRAVELLGAVVNSGVQETLEAADDVGRTVLASRQIDHPAWPNANVRTPTIRAVDADDSDVYATECFGPVSFLIATDSTAESIRLFRDSVREHGAMTASVYSTNDAVLAAMEEAAVDVGVALSMNLTDRIYVNQTAAFSDFHGTGANPAANASFTDGAFLTNRFHIVQARRPA